MKPFRNLSIFHIDGGLEELKPFRPCAPLEGSTGGWVPLRDDQFTMELGANTLLQFQTETKILPATTLKRMANEEAASMARITGEKPSRAQLRDIQETLRLDLLPQALTTRQTTGVWIDNQAKLLMIDSISPAKCDTIIAAIPGPVITRHAFGNGPVNLMRNWIGAGAAEGLFSMENDCRMGNESGSAVAYINLDIDDDRVREQLHDGMLPQSLGLNYDDRVSFILRADGGLSRITISDYVSDEFAEKEYDPQEANLMLMTGEYQPLIAAMFAALEAVK